MPSSSGHVLKVQSSVFWRRVSLVGISVIIVVVDVGFAF
jgi:hypothetical protein